MHHQFTKPSTPKNFFRSKTFLLVNLAVLVLLGWAAVKVFWRYHGVNQEIKGLKAEIARLESGNRELSKLSEYLQTDLFVEREARLKLGLRKPDEQVAVIPAGLGQLAQITASEDDNQDLNNPQKWQRYFFQ